MALSQAAVAVVGGGIAGLASALNLSERLPAEQIAIIERAPWLGGKIQTERAEGFVIEAGPDSFLSAKPGGVELSRRIGLADRLVGTLPATHRSYVRRGGRLHQLPDGISGLIPSRLAPLLTSSLLSWRGRARAGLDLVLPSRRDVGEESIASFVQRRLGVEVYDWLVEPLLSGIYAGDGAALSLDATFPQLRDLERVHGGLIRGILRRGRPARPAPTNAGSPFLTPRGGMGEMIEALEARLATCRLLRGTGVVALERSRDGYLLRLSNGTALGAEAVILATPASEAARILRSLDDSLAARLNSLPSVSVATVSLAYPRSALPEPLRGYGYLRPRAEGGPIVAGTWVSAKWPDRAPPGFVLIRAFVGRAGEERAASLSEGELVALVRQELGEVLRVTEQPHLWRVHRWPGGMPQYTLGHAARLGEIERGLARHPGLLVAGHSYHGIGIPDCIRSGERAAVALAAGRLEVRA